MFEIRGSDIEFALVVGSHSLALIMVGYHPHIPNRNVSEHICHNASALPAQHVYHHAKCIQEHHPLHFGCKDNANNENLRMSLH